MTPTVQHVAVPALVTVLIMVDGYVTGVVRSQLLYPIAAEETGLSDEEFWTRQYPVLEKAMATGAYPTLAALSEDAFGLGWGESFEWGLQRLLDGIQALVASRSHASPALPPARLDPETGGRTLQQLARCPRAAGRI